VRRLVDCDLGGNDRLGDVRSLFNLDDSDGSAVARHKDDYIGEAVEEAFRAFEIVR
jgi:hypothetical protein